MKKRLTLKELQDLQLSMAKDIHKLCEENKIEYFMVSGTLLGAVRHNGFIPWDDDIDFGMMRADYDAFVEVCKNGALGDKYVLINNETNPNFEFPITRIGRKNTYSFDPMRDHIKDCKCTYIDIVPFDNIPDDKDKRALHKKQIAKYRRLIYYRTSYRYEGFPKIKRLASIVRARIFRLLPLSYYIDRYQKLLCQYKNESTEYCGALSGRYDYDKEAMPRKYFEKRSLMKFEDTELWGLSDYDSVLSHLYGDYMKLPPKEEQKIRHEVYITD